MIRIAMAALLAVVAAAGAGYAYGRHAGKAAVQARWDIDKIAQRQAIAEAVQRALDVTQTVVTQYVDRVHVIVAQGETIIKQVPVYVTPAADSRCVVPRGFVWLLDSAATGDALPGAATGAADAPSGLALSAVAGSVSANYTGCRANAARLIALQTWARGVSEAAP